MEENPEEDAGLDPCDELEEEMGGEDGMDDDGMGDPENMEGNEEEEGEEDMMDDFGKLQMENDLGEDMEGNEEKEGEEDLMDDFGMEEENDYGELPTKGSATGGSDAEEEEEEEERTDDLHVADGEGDYDVYDAAPPAGSDAEDDYIQEEEEEEQEEVDPIENYMGELDIGKDKGTERKKTDFGDRDLGEPTSSKAAYPCWLKDCDSLM
jgi:hypothetical protein